MRPVRPLLHGCAVALVLSVLLVAPASAAVGTAPLPYCSVNVNTQVVTCAPTEAGLAAARHRAAVASLAPTYLLARLFDDANRTGVYYEVVASGPCDTNADLDWEVANIGSAWNDRVSSFQGYSSCQVRVYENASYGGASYGTYTSTDNVGEAMNDRTTSMRFY